MSSAKFRECSESIRAGQARRRVLAVLGGGALLALGAAGAAQAQDAGPCGAKGTVAGLEVIGLSADQRLLCFLDTEANQPRELARISGLPGGEQLLDIDFRPSSGALFGLGNQGGIYRIDPATGAATQQAVLRDAAGMPLPLSSLGARFAIDFDPAEDRLRIVSDTGRNLSASADDGSTRADSDLNPAPGASIGAIAYALNDADPDTGSLLYALDTRADVVQLVAPQRAGALNLLRGLGADVQDTAAFDVFSQIEDGTTVRGVGLAVLGVGGVQILVEVDLATGLSGELSQFASGTRVVALAIPLQQSGMAPPEGARPPLRGLAARSATAPARE
jgi:hypothetical protein